LAGRTCTVVEEDLGRTGDTKRTRDLIMERRIQVPFVKDMAASSLDDGGIRRGTSASRNTDVARVVVSLAEALDAIRERKR
jgi:hypothetical protein